MEDLIPLLIFAVISALSGLAKKKGEKDNVELEEESELDAPREDARNLGPPPLSYEETLLERLKERAGKRSETKIPPRSSEEARQAKAAREPAKLPKGTLASQKHKEIEEAKRKRLLASKQLEEAKKKTRSQKGGSNLSLDPISDEDIFRSPGSIRKGFIASLVFDKPVSLKEDRDW